METTKTLEAVQKLLEIQQKVLSSPEREEIDTSIASFEAAYEEQLQVVEGIEAKLSDTERQIQELTNSLPGLKEQLEAEKESAEGIEYNLEQLLKKRTALFSSFEELGEYKDTLESLSAVLSQVSTLLSD
jgi:chromosome segregation ATPase